VRYATVYSGVLKKKQTGGANSDLFQAQTATRATAEDTKKLMTATSTITTETVYTVHVVQTYTG